MRVPLSWLREFCPVEHSAEELAEILTMCGLNVEALLRPWERLQGVVIARVVDVADHPESDRLCVTRVDAGQGPVEVVAGVRNMRPGDLVPWAPPGATIPTSAQALEKLVLRGITSNGMLCSPRELAISAEHDRILVLPPDAPVGAEVRTEFGLDDVVFDIEILSNRADLQSVVGVAREAAAATNRPFTMPDTTLSEGDAKAADAATVEIHDLERCPRYLARVIRDVTVGPSPIQAQARLTAAGMRPLSNVVDATNYVMLEMGQPLHPFDLSLLEGAGIVVRRASEGERIRTLDDVDRELSPDDLVIADHAKAVAIAGVMGSAPAEVSPATNDVLLESAHFDRAGVARTSQRLGLRSEASARFERGADPEGVASAADRAAGLIVRWSGGTVLAGAIDVGRPPDRRFISVRPSRASLLLGMPVGAPDVESSLNRIGIATRSAGDAVEAEIPGFRPDVEREIDLVEEVIRIQGYERVGETLPGVRQSGGVPARYALRGRIREALARAGLHEIASYSFASQDDLRMTGDHDAVAVANPLAADDAFLRTSLIPGLLRAVRQNLSHQVRTAALFEVGRVFFPGEGAAVEERDRVALAMSGEASAGYPEPQRHLDFSDAKGALELLLEMLWVTEWELGRPPSRRLFHPTRSASVLMGGELAGEVGELHPRVAARLDVPGRVAAAELEIGVLARVAGAPVRYREVPRFPPVHRDLAFVADERTPAGALAAAIRESAEGLAEDVTLFDVWSGRPIPENKRSLAFAVQFRAPDRTLTDEEVDRAVDAIRERLARDLRAELRSS
jgi:phenylalanyl-tRNA synthetase beta chain